MFTGIVEEKGVVRSVGRNSISVRASVTLGGTKIGDSIAVNGVCLTVIELDKSGFAVEIMPETRKLTNVGSMKVSDVVNLERAVPAVGRFGGHFVQGHVDATGKVLSLAPEEEAVIASIGTSGEVLRYVVKKGFIAVNGVSLTVVDLDESKFSVSLVTYTRDNTNLGLLRQGNVVNLEADIVAKYVEKYYRRPEQEGIINVLEKYDYLKAR